MTYKVVLSQQARRYYSSAPVDIARRLARVFETLESDFHPPGAKALKGELKGLYRIRVGNIRLVYEPRKDRAEIRIVAIGARGDIY